MQLLEHCNVKVSKENSSNIFTIENINQTFVIRVDWILKRLSDNLTVKLHELFNNRRTTFVIKGSRWKVLIFKIDAKLDFVITGSIKNAIGSQLSN